MEQLRATELFESLLPTSMEYCHGAGFSSKSTYLFGKANVQIKLVAGDSAGTVTAFYGAVIDEMRKSIEDGSNKRFIYLGDGSEDFCPTLKLTEIDDVLPRKEYPLWKLIEKNPDLVKAKVEGWCNARDVEDSLMKLLKQ